MEEKRRAEAASKPKRKTKAQSKRAEVMTTALRRYVLEAAKDGASLAAVVEPFRHRLMAVLAPLCGCACPAAIPQLTFFEPVNPCFDNELGGPDVR